MMIKKYAIILSTTSLAAFMLSAPVFADSHGMVNGYVTGSSGALMSSYEKCVRTTMKDSTKKLEDCGYKPMVEKSLEVVATPTAVSATKRVGKQVVLAAGILFDFDSAELSDDGKLIIVERIAALGHKENKAEIQVVGHTDSTGPEAYNQKLSERRAMSVARFIEQMKASPDANVEAIGKGESEPFKSNDTREGRAANRRVEITAVGILAE
ncbi:MAG: OmpA family protein [Gammaproteobacteria bacterium]|nr:OmpA family protein [Gammaproteobacteria bacterium]